MSPYTTYLPVSRYVVHSYLAYLTYLPHKSSLLNQKPFKKSEGVIQHNTETRSISNMSLSKESSSITPSLPPPSPPQKFRASRYSKRYMRSLALFPKLLDKEETFKFPIKVGSSKYFLLTVSFAQQIDLSKLAHGRSGITSLQLLSPISVISPFLRAASLTNSKLAK